jgi:hypothetical protein
MKIEIDQYSTSPALLRLAAEFYSKAADVIEEERKAHLKDVSPLFSAPAEEPPAAKKRKPAKTAETPSTEEPLSSAENATGSDTERTLVEVRAILAEKSKAGKTAEVKALIAEYGVSMLTQIPEDKLTDVYNKGAQL